MVDALDEVRIFLGENNARLRCRRLVRRTASCSCALGYAGMARKVAEPIPGIAGSFSAAPTRKMTKVRAPLYPFDGLVLPPSRNHVHAPARSPASAAATWRARSSCVAVCVAGTGRAGPTRTREPTAHWLPPLAGAARLLPVPNRFLGGTGGSSRRAASLRPAGAPSWGPTGALGSGAPAGATLPLGIAALKHCTPLALGA